MLASTMTGTIEELSCRGRRCLLRLWRVFLQRLAYHVVDFAFDLHGIALFHRGNSAPYQGMRDGVQQIDDEGAFGVRHSHDARAPSAPSSRICLRLHLAGRPERVSHVEVGWAGRHGQTPGGEVPIDGGLYALLDQFAIERWVPAIQLAVADGERPVLGETGGGVEFYRDFLGKCAYS